MKDTRGGENSTSDNAAALGIGCGVYRSDVFIVLQSERCTSDLIRDFSDAFSSRSDRLSLLLAKIKNCQNHSSLDVHLSVRRE